MALPSSVWVGGSPFCLCVFAALAKLTEDEVQPSAAAAQSITEPSAAGMGDEDPHDIEVLEQLLYIENAEAAYDTAKKDEDDKLRDFDEQISTKELLLQKLQSSMKYFAGIQAKYDEAMEELKKTEDEKALLERKIRESEEAAASKKVR